jgi:leucyl/phenylalanyl-tRNA---protein transferase
MPIFQLTEELIFPHPELAEDGWLAIGGNLSPDRLLLAYSNGIFPWPEGEDSPLYWASPDPRTVLLLKDFTSSNRLKRTIRQNKFKVTFDSHFDSVIQNCSAIPRPDQDGTWITSDMQAAYADLHKMGFVHSVETHLDGVLVGGLYGLSLGGAFFGESMFHLVNDASKVAFYFLVQRLRDWNFDFIDAQVSTQHLLDWGATEIDRSSYLKLLAKTLEIKTRRGSW